MGDLNTRCLRWDTKGNERGSRLEKWARQNGWTVKTPNKPSFKPLKSTSKPDIFLSARVHMGKPFIDTTSNNEGRDHYPVYTAARITEETHGDQNRACIPRRQRRNPLIPNKAKEFYKTILRNCLEKAQNANNTNELEVAYETFKSTILYP